MSNPALLEPSTVLALGLVLAATAVIAAYWLRRTPQDWPVIAALAVCCFGFALTYNGFLPDDSYITYRYAHNLLQGQGLVFNPGERVLSTTTPLYTLLLAAAGLAWPDLPVTSHVLSMPALFAGALFLYLLCARHGKPVAGLVLGVLTILNPFTAAVYSSESILHVALIAGAVYAYDRRALGWAGLLAGLAVVNRGDGALLAGALGIHWLLSRAWRTTARAQIARAAALYALTVVPWYAFAWLYYGTLAPATLAAKIAQSALPGTMVFGPGLGFWWMAYAQQSLLYWLIPPLALIGLLATMPRQGDRWAWPFLLWGLLYALGYTILAVPRYQNYYTPLVPVLLLLTVLGAHWLGVALVPLVRRGAGRLRAARPASAALVVLLAGVGIAGAFAVTAAALFPRLPQAREVVYQEIGDWLRANTPPGATVGMMEVGTMSYYAERHVIDFYGLIQPDIAAHLAQNQTAWGPEHYMPDYMAICPAWYLPGWEANQQGFTAWFDAHYHAVQTFTDPRFTCPAMVIYARQ